MINEKLIYYGKKVRRARWHFYLIAITLIVIAFYSWTRDIDGFDLNIVSTSFLFFGIIMLTYLEISIRAKRITITDARLVIDEGILRRDSTTIKYPMITEIVVKQNVGQRIFNFGDLYIHTAGLKKRELVMDALSKPMKIKKTIEYLMHRSHGHVQQQKQTTSHSNKS